MNTKERQKQIGSRITTVGLVISLLLAVAPVEAGNSKNKSSKSGHSHHHHDDDREDRGHRQPKKLVLFGAEPDLTISGLNFGKNDYRGLVTLFNPELGTVELDLKRYSGYEPGVVQELAVALPEAVINYPGTFTLTMKTGHGASKADSMDVAIGSTGPQGPTGAQGIQGLTGPTGPVGPQGDPGLIFTGEWINGLTYLENFVVTHNGSTWISQRPNSSVTPVEGDDWTVLAQKGDDGAEGPQGEAGPAGPQGPTGTVGPMGPRGSDGLQGPTGLTGPQGPQGTPGPVGPEGPEGPQGADGTQGASPFVLDGNNASFGGFLGLGTATPAGPLHVESPLVLGTSALDQSQLVGSLGNASGSGASGWQSFTAGSSGVLSSVDIKCRSAIDDATDSPGLLNVYSGEGTSGTPLASVSVVVSANGGTEILQSFAIPTAVNISAGQKYTWELTASSFSSSRSWLAGTDSREYNGGKNDQQNNREDYVFETYVGTILAPGGSLVVSGGKVGINTDTPQTELDVAGIISASSFVGDGSGLSGLNASQISSGQFDSPRIAPQAIGTAKIENGAVTDAKIASVDASKIASGVLAVARIPNLDASNISSGTFGDARIASVSANKLTGMINAAQIPDLAATKITSGTLAAGRIPNLSATKITSGTLGTGRIPNLSAAKITSGSFGASRIGTGAITTTKLQDAAVTIDKIGQNAVGSGKLAPDSVKTGKIVNLAVTTEKIADAAITEAKLDSDLYDNLAKLDTIVVQPFKSGIRCKSYNPKLYLGDGSVENEISVGKGIYTISGTATDTLQCRAPDDAVFAWQFGTLAPCPAIPLPITRECISGHRDTFISPARSKT
ncbi:MAG: hypothetical protein ACPGVU_04445 [Limisphaerales bacterium]